MGGRPSGQRSSSQPKPSTGRLVRPVPCGAVHGVERVGERVHTALGRQVDATPGPARSPGRGRARRRTRGRRGRRRGRPPRRRATRGRRRCRRHRSRPPCRRPPAALRRRGRRRSAPRRAGTGSSSQRHTIGQVSPTERPEPDARPGEGRTDARPTSTRPPRAAGRRRPAGRCSRSRWCGAACATWSSTSMTCLHHRTKSPADSSPPLRTASRLRPAAHRCTASTSPASSGWIVSTLCAVSRSSSSDQARTHASSATPRRLARAAGDARLALVVAARAVHEGRDGRREPRRVELVEDAATQALREQQVVLRVQPAQPPPVVGDLQGGATGVVRRRRSGSRAAAGCRRCGRRRRRSTPSGPRCVRPARRARPPGAPSAPPSGRAPRGPGSCGTGARAADGAGRRSRRRPAPRAGHPSAGPCAWAPCRCRRTTAEQRRGRDVRPARAP